MSFKKYGWVIQKKLISIDQSRFYIFSHPGELKMFNITLKYFSFFNNKPTAS